MQATVFSLGSVGFPAADTLEKMSASGFFLASFLAPLSLSAYFVHKRNVQKPVSQVNGALLWLYADSPLEVTDV